MVQLKKRPIREQTDSHISITLINWARNYAKEIVFTNKKVEFHLKRGTVLIDPLFLIYSNTSTLADRFNLYFSRGEISLLEAQITEND